MKVFRWQNLTSLSAGRILLLIFVIAPLSAGAGAVRTNAGFTTNVIPANDDCSNSCFDIGSVPAGSPVPLGFTINFFGVPQSAAFVNNNGNITFGSPLGSFTPEGILGSTLPIIAPFWADVDTRGVGSSLVTYGQDTVNGHLAFGVNWVNVGYFGSHVDKLNSFQLVLIDRSDIVLGHFDIEFNYDRILWETGDASGGINGFGGTPAAAGFSNGTGATGTSFEVSGSRVSGAFLDSNPIGLTHRSLVFSVRGGIITSIPPVFSSLCGSISPPPAPISGSNGAQGVLDPTNTILGNGVIWPSNAVTAQIDLQMGVITFLDSSNVWLGGDLLPGSTIPGAFPDGRLNFLSVRLSQGKSLKIHDTSSGGVVHPVLLLSCQDVILETGSSLSFPGVVLVPTAARRLQLIASNPGLSGILSLLPLPNGNDLGNGSAELILASPAGAFRGSPSPANGFGPRTSGALPAEGSLYPPVGGAGSSSGGGGTALGVFAKQRIAVNGTIRVGGVGGAGGSVRLAAVLVEGVGTIETLGAGGNRSGPIEIQAFLQNLFTCSTTAPCTTAPIVGNPVVKPIPDNLPTIEVKGVFVASSDFCRPQALPPCLNTGSLTTPIDVTITLSPLPITRQSVRVEVRTTGVPVSTTAPVNLNFRAVGTDGSVSEASAPVVAITSPSPCTGIQGACAVLNNLNPGVVYQIVVTPTSAFPLARNESGPLPLAEPILAAGVTEGARFQVSGVRLEQELSNDGASDIRAATVRERSSENTEPTLEQWGRAFGVDLGAQKKLARLTAVTSDK